MNDILKTVQSQYQTSPKMLSLLHGLNEVFDPSKDIDLFYNMYFLIENAQGLVLDYWGRIVGIERTIKIKENTFFGFFGQDGDSFNNANFYVTGVSDVYLLSDDAYRTLILLKAGVNISSCDAESINKVLQEVFKNNKCYVIERKNMVIRYVFEFYLEEFERAIIEEIDIFPRATGVKTEYLEVQVAETFGFYGSGFSGFSQASFMEKGIIEIL